MVKHSRWWVVVTIAPGLLIGHMALAQIFRPPIAGYGAPISHGVYSRSPSASTAGNFMCNFYVPGSQLHSLAETTEQKLPPGYEPSQYVSCNQNVTPNSSDNHCQLNGNTPLPNNSTPSCTTGNSISFTLGEKIQSETDIVFDNGSPIRFSRHYGSASFQPQAKGSFGNQWNHHYDWIVEPERVVEVT